MGAGSFSLALSGWLFMAVVMFLLSFVQRARKDAGIVDVGWAAGMGLLAVFYAVTAFGDLNRRVILAVLAGFWSFRLASHVIYWASMGNRAFSHSHHPPWRIRTFVKPIRTSCRAVQALISCCSQAQ